MKKHTKRKHRPAGLHPLDAILASQPFPESELTRILLKVHDAFLQLRNGTTDTDMFDRLAMVMNVGLVRSEAIGEAGVEVFLAAQKAMRECDDIYGRHQRFGFTGPGLDAMKAAVLLYEEILCASTPLQMHHAQQVVVKRIQAGNYEQAQSATIERRSA